MKKLEEENERQTDRQSDTETEIETNSHREGYYEKLAQCPSSNSWAGKNGGEINLFFADCQW